MKVKNLLNSILVLLLCSLLTACLTSDEPAPVDNAWYQSPDQTYHKVRSGETLYAVAWRYDLDYRDLAKYNNLSAPYMLKTGQQLTLHVRSSRTDVINKNSAEVISPKIIPAAEIKISTTSGIKPVSVLSNKVKQQSKRRQTKLPEETETAEKLEKVTGTWQWPVRGAVLRGYSLSEGRKGIDISGRKGMSVKAAGAGRIAYAGQGLRGYGNLIIIKHNNVYLSAYAHNDKLLVKEGEPVKAGQVIAEMGNSDANNKDDQAILHFEIRKAGKPVNPLNYLP